MKPRFVIALVALVTLVPSAAALDLTVGVPRGALPIELPPVQLAVSESQPHGGPASSSPSASSSSNAPLTVSGLPSLPPAPIVVDLRVADGLVDRSLGLVQGELPESPRSAPANVPQPPAPMERVYVGHDAPAASSAITPVAALAAVAAVTAVGPAVATLSWERLRRFAPWAALYARITKERLLDHGGRERLLAAVRASPGIALSDAARIADIPRNTAVYHFMRLEKEGLVSSLRQGRTRLYFAPGGLDQRENASAIAALRHPVTLDIATEVGAKPGLDQQALCQRFGIGPSLAHWHAARLVDAGIVTAQREGRRVRYYPGASYSLVKARAA